MSSTLVQLIRQNYQRPVRKIWMKRRYFSDASYETDWVRIDLYNGINIVETFGSPSLEIDHQPGQISNFDVPSVSITFKNDNGLWNYESDPQSLFYPDSTYLSRKYTKIKIETGYFDEDGVTEIGVDNVFEGVVDQVTLSEDQSATVTVLSYLTILQRYPIKDLSLTGSKTVSQVITAIMNQSKITTFIPYVAPMPGTDITITDTSTLTGTYWDVIKLLAYHSNSVPLLVGNVWSFTARTPGASSQWDFKGAGNTDDTTDIFEVEAYDDEGADRVRVYWQSSDQAYSAISTNAVLLKKYLSDPQSVDLSFYSGADKQTALNSLLATWETPKPRIEFTTRFLVNYIKPLDRITIKIFGAIFPLNYVRYAAGPKYADGSLYGGVRGGINIFGSSWVVTQVVKDLDEWVCKIKAEKI